MKAISVLTSVPRHEDVRGSGDITLRILQPRACWKSLVKFEARGLPSGTHRTGHSQNSDTVGHREVSTSAGNQTPISLSSKPSRDLERAARDHTCYKYQTSNLFSSVIFPPTYRSLPKSQHLIPTKSDQSNCHTVPNN